MKGASIIYVAATLIAALIPALLTQIGGVNPLLIPIAFAVALAHALLLGLPVALIAASRGWMNALSGAVIGFAIGALPIGLFSIVEFADSASIDGVPTVVGGVRTIAGWTNYFEVMALAGVFGAAGGISFWSMLKIGRLPIVTTQTSALAPASGRVSGKVSVALAASALLATAGVFAIPAIMKDRTCHNPMRDGRNSIGSELNADLQIAANEWPALIQTFDEFAATNDWSFRNDSKSGEGSQVLYLSVCDSAGTQISAIQQIWPGSPEGVLRRGVSLSVYQPQGGLSWREPSRELLSTIRLRTH